MLHFVPVARTIGLPGDGSDLYPGVETEIYSILAHACRNVSDSKLLRRQLAYASSRLQGLLRKGADPNKAVRLVTSLTSRSLLKVEHAVILLHRKYCSIEVSRQFKVFARGVVLTMYQAGLRWNSYIFQICSWWSNRSRGLLPFMSALHIQRHWRRYRRRKAALRIQAAWHSFLFRKRVLHNPHTPLGLAWLQRVAAQHCQ